MPGKGFVPGSIDSDTVDLNDVRSAVKYGFIWINFDDDAPVTRGVPRHIRQSSGAHGDGADAGALVEVHHRSEANWKVALEAFLEAYHVMQAHPELALGATGDDYDIDQFPYFHHGMGHVDSTTPFDPATTFSMPDAPIRGDEPGRFFIDQNRVLFEGTDAFATARDEYIADRVRDLPDDEVLGRFYEELYKYAAEADIPLPALDPNASSYGFVFPNFVFLGMTGNLLFYRVRPNGHDPNSSIFEALAMQIPREADKDNAAPRPRRSAGR